jgi:hypothetical protein
MLTPMILKKERRSLELASVKSGEVLLIGSGLGPKIVVNPYLYSHMSWSAQYMVLRSGCLG